MTRIQYMYENGGICIRDFAVIWDLSEFSTSRVLRRFPNDRTMLEKCENLQNTIKDQKQLLRKREGCY